MGKEISLNVLNQKNEGSPSREKHSWVVKVEEEVNKLENIPETAPLFNKKYSIYRRPVNVRERPDTSFLYTPCIVSFGPYHHDLISCQQLNEMKEMVLVHWLKRSRKKLDDFLDDLTKVVEDLKDAYDQLDPKWQHDDDAFLQLMIYDGCFLLEILREAESLDAQNHLGFCTHQICAMYGISQYELMEYYKHDMLLLENQLPMKLLVKLVAVESNPLIQAAEDDLYKLILKFLEPSSPNITKKMLTEGREGMYLHVLDLYRRSLLYQENIELSFAILAQTLQSLFQKVMTLFITMTLCFLIFIPLLLLVLIILAIIYCPLQILKYFFRTKPPTDIHFIIPSATELDKVGIGFKVNRTKKLTDISFGRGTLRLPQIYVDGATQSRLLNIIAFEQLHADAKNEVTSYIYFMSRLLQVAADVRLLQVRCIILTTLQNDEVVELFKSLAKDIAHDPNIFLVETYRYVGKRLTKSFYIKMNNAWQRDLWQTYLKSPWAVISIVAAFFLFSLTTIQTVYTVLGYYNPK